MLKHQYKTGQRVIGMKGAGSRIIVKATPTKIAWKSGSKKGLCTVTSFRSWQKGKNLAKNR